MTINILMNHSSSCSQKIRDTEAFYDSIIEYLQKNDKILTKNTPSQTEELILSYFKDPENIIHKLNNTESEMINTFNSDNIIKNYFILQQNLEKIKLEFNDLQKIHTELEIKYKLVETKDKLETSKEMGNKNLNDVAQFSNTMIFFSPDSKKMNKIDIIEGDTSVLFDITENLSYYAAICRLPENKIFYYGGKSTIFIDSVYIIDLLELTIQKKKSRKLKRAMGSCYYQNEVYIFGGYNELAQIISGVEKYNYLNDS